MPAKKKPTTKKAAPKRPPKNPTDPNLLAKAVLEAAIGEPLFPEKTDKKIKNPTKTPKMVKDRGI